MKNISGVARIWCEGHETRCRLRSVGGLETESPRPLAHLWEANPPWPQNFLHNFSGEISTDSADILLKYIQFQNSIYRFPKERLAIHLC